MSLRNPAGKYRLAVMNVNSQEDTGRRLFHSPEFHVLLIRRFFASRDEFSLPGRAGLKSLCEK